MSDISNQELDIIFNLEEGLNVYLLDQSFNYLFFNEIHKRDMADHFGVEIKQGENKVKYLPAPYAQDFQDLYQRALENDAFKHVLKYQDEFVEFRFFPFSFKGQKRLLVKTRPISDEILMNKELEKYQEKLEVMVKSRTQEISNQRDFFQRLLDEDPSLIFLRDIKGKYRLVNLSMAQALHKTPESVIGASLQDLIPDQKITEQYLAEDDLILNSGQEIQEIRPFYVKREDFKWLSVRKKRVQISGESYVLGVMSDISDLIKTREALEATNNELNDTIDDLKEMQLRLVTTEKIASILLLTSGFMHEISNPINYVSGNVQPLRQDIDELKAWLMSTGVLANDKQLKSEFEIVSEEMETLLNGIEEGTERVKGLVKNLKKLSYSEPENETNCDFHEIIDGVITMLSLLLEEKKIFVEKIFTSKRKQVYTKPSYLNQIIINVMDYVVSRMTTEDPLIVKTSDKEDLIMIEVVDENRGLPADEIQRMMDPFDKIGDTAKVGLAVSYRIANKMNGTIKTHNEDHATHFSIAIPVSNKSSL